MRVGSQRDGQGEAVLAVQYREDAALTVVEIDSKDGFRTLHFRRIWSVGNPSERGQKRRKKTEPFCSPSPLLIFDFGSTDSASPCTVCR